MEIKIIIFLHLWLYLADWGLLIVFARERSERGNRMMLKVPSNVLKCQILAVFALYTEFILVAIAALHSQ